MCPGLRDAAAAQYQSHSHYRCGATASGGAGAHRVHIQVCQVSVPYFIYPKENVITTVFTLFYSSCTCNRKL